MIKSNISFFISSNISDLIKKSNYEPLICNMMNKSQIVFKSSYKYIEEQPNSEPDFIDLNSGEKFDAKLFLTTEQGKILGANKKNIDGYASWIACCNNELADCLITNAEAIKESLVYKNILRFINEIKDEENLIVFFTYPFMSVDSRSIVEYFFNDYLDYLYKELKQFFTTRKLYFIYPTIDNKIVLRSMGENTKEYIENKLFFQYVKCN